MSVHGLHHVAYRCKDAKETVEFYKKYLDLEFNIAVAENKVPSSGEWIDPSVIDKANPDHRDIGLDLYAGEVNPPYSDEFIRLFRNAQLSRTRRITDRVFDELETLRRIGGAEKERPFIVHRTMADPSFLDTALEPNDRRAA